MDKNSLLEHDITVHMRNGSTFRGILIDATREVVHLKVGIDDVLINDFDVIAYTKHGAEKK